MVKRISNSARKYVEMWVPQREEGQGLVEYGLILAGVSVAALVALFALGPKIKTLFNTVGASLG
jgi:pilus assembly protein Flp/PilA